MSSKTASAIALARGPLIGTFLGLAQVHVPCYTHSPFLTVFGDVTGYTGLLACRLFSTSGHTSMTPGDSKRRVLETIHAAFTIWVMDDYLIVQYANVSALEAATWFVSWLSFVWHLTISFCKGHRRRSGDMDHTAKSTYILGLLIDFYVYLYFTWRIWLFTKSISIVVLMSALSISRTGEYKQSPVFPFYSLLASPRHQYSCQCHKVQLAVLFALASSSHPRKYPSALKPTWRNYLDSSRTLLIVGNMLFIAGDTFSACAMAYHLTKFKSWAHALPLSPPRRIDSLLNRLLIFAVATGALTSLVDVIALILTLTQPQSLAFLSAILIQTRLYANSLLASLNIRNAASRAYEDAVSTPIELPVISLRFARPSDLSTVTERGRRGDGNVHDCPVVQARKSAAESWHTTHAQSTTLLPVSV
ncbi:hypothetical protein J3R83DRAFT_11059 [Lanmaoa asiatica]|nr:hypothetical protein J3R83DRAFT_11059 [Lanmaoa asiatica]